VDLLSTGQVVVDAAATVSATAKRQSITIQSGKEELGNGVDHVRLAGSLQGPTASIQGGPGETTLDLTGLSGVTVEVTGKDSGTILVAGQPPVRFSGVENLIMSGVLKMEAGGSLTGFVNDPSGNLHIQYSTRKTGMVANLDTGAATGIAGGVYGVQEVDGGRGPNLIIGGQKTVKLVGGRSGDVLVNGSVPASLDGENTTTVAGLVALQKDLGGKNGAKLLGDVRADTTINPADILSVQPIQVHGSLAGKIPEMFSLGDSAVTITLASPPTKGSFSYFNADGGFKYAPKRLSTGIDSFTCLVQMANGDQETVTLYLKLGSSPR
jgi:hypothetical protein